MSLTRVRRVGDEIKRVISNAIQHNMKDPRIPPFTSVTEVEVTRDLSHATCFISVFGNGHQQQDGLQALEGAGGFLRSEVARKIRLRAVPELHFRLDRSVEEGMYMDALIDRVMGRDKGEGTDAED